MKLPMCLSAVAVLQEKLKMSNDLHIFGRAIMCPMKQILTRKKAICRRNPLKEIFTSMHGPVKFVCMF